MFQIYVLIILIISITKSFGDNESIQSHNIEDTEDEPIYINHKYFGDESMGSIQKCNIFITTKILQLHIHNDTDKCNKIILI